MKRIWGLSTLIVWFSFLTACGSDDGTSALEGIAHDDTGKNVALIFGASNGLEGPETDVKMFAKLLRNPIYRFSTVKEDSAATNTNILSLTSKNSGPETDSMIWYFSGHGGGGAFMTEGAALEWTEVEKQIIASRQGKPLKRLVVFIDTCEAGDLADGDHSIIKNVMQHFEAASARKAGYFEQAFVFASSTKSEPSFDIGPEDGGLFTENLRIAIRGMYRYNPNVTIKEVADETVAITQMQHPVYRAFPTDAVLNDYFFKYGN